MEKERLIELVGKAQSADKNALVELFYNFKDSVYFVAGKLLGSAEAAEEVVTETTEIVLRKLDTLDVPDGFFSWVRMIADSVIIKKLGGGFVSALAAQTSYDTSVGDASAVSKEQFDTSEVRSLVATLVDTLPEDLKLCSYMYYYQRLAIENIAKVLGVDKNAATAKLYAALNDIEAAAAEHETSAGTLSAAPAWLIASSLYEAGSRFTLSKERSFELLNAAGKAAYAPKPEPAAEPAPEPETEEPTNEEVISREAAATIDDSDEVEESENAFIGKAEKKDKKSKAHRDDEDDDLDDDDDYDDDEDYDDERPGFFSTLWGKLLIGFLALAIIGAAAAIFLPKILNRDNGETDTPAVTDQQPEAQPEVQPEPQGEALITAESLAATYYGYYTDADNVSGTAPDTMELTADGSWSSGGSEGTYIYDDTSMKLTLTTTEGAATEWNCWLDGENIVISQKVSETESASMVYNYYQSETLRDDALAAVDAAA